MKSNHTVITQGIPHQKLKNMNIELKDGFTQVCIWPGCIVVNDEDSSQDKINEFEQFMFDKFKARVQYLEEIKTKPDHDKEYKPVKDTGGRNDLFFAVHNESIGLFAIPRLAVGIRWIEDVLSTGNYGCHIYPDRIFEYITWNKADIEFPVEI